MNRNEEKILNRKNPKCCMCWKPARLQSIFDIDLPVLYFCSEVCKMGFDLDLYDNIENGNN